jgi:uncharacterized repeat protein (TIGR02543 family)
LYPYQDKENFPEGVIDTCTLFHRFDGNSSNGILGMITKKEIGNRMKKRFLAILLAVTTLLSQLPPLSALAETGDQKALTVTEAAVTAHQEKETFDNPFIDVEEDSWYYDAVRYAFINGFFSGTSAATFDPNGKLTRGMFVTILARMAGVDASSYQGQSDFIDVSPDAWYAPFVAWAVKHGITAGVGNGKFDPDGLITREQMAVFFVRYFETFGVKLDTGVNITTVPADLDAVSPWARESVLKLWQLGLLSGDGVNFNPSATASRAEAAALSMRTDKTVETWYKEPGVPSDRVSIDPDTEPSTGTTDQTDHSGGSPSGNIPDTNTAPEGDSNGGGSSGGDSPGGGPSDDDPGESGKTYYKVTFVTDSSSKEQLYEENTLLSALPASTQPSKVFLGWYYDEETLNPVTASDRLTRNITLYAKFADAAEVPEGGTPSYVTALDQQPGFSVAVKSANEPLPNIDFKFRNITDPNRTPENGGSAEDVNIEHVKVTNIGNGVWTISAANSGGFTPGHTYQIELISEDVIFDDSADAFGNMKENNPLYDAAQVRFFNFTIEKNGTLNLKLNGSIKYIKAEEVLPQDKVALMDYSGLYLAATDSQGATTYIQNNASGTFTYLGNENIAVGDTVAVYEGTHPAERKPEKGTDESRKTDNGDVTYVKITYQDGNTYTYVAADAEDVMFMPDVLPIDVDANDGTIGWSLGGTSVTIDNNKLQQFIDNYESLSEKTGTTVDVGDYLAFYTGNFGQSDAVQLAYGEILEITGNGNQTLITYQLVDESVIMSSADVYDETGLSESELEELIAANKEKIEQLIADQLAESGFFDEAGQYLAEVTLTTDEVQEVFGDGLTLSDVVITYADGTPIGSDELKLMGSIKDNELDGKRPRFTVNISKRLSHFSGRSGVRAEVSVSYTFKIQKKDSEDDNDQVLEINLTAFFEQEVMIGLSVSGGIVWKKKWFIPYISDYRMTGNVDLGTYTGLGITATAKLKDKEEPWGIPWPENVSRAAANAKVFSLSQSIREKIEKMEKIVPDDDDTVTASGGLAEKYARFMNDVNKDWVDLVTADLLTWTGAVDPLHIVAYGLDVDFVVSANLNVALGITYQYEKSKRHIFTLYLLGRKASNDTIDLGVNGYQLDLYVMGHIGLRAGIRAKVTIGLFSTKLAGIGLQFETGAYARLWGYFYYYLENWKRNGVWQPKSGYSGALLIEIGTYLDVKFIAEALNGKFRFDPSLITKEWPLWSAGQRENVYDFAYQANPAFEILNVTRYTIPGSVFDMAWMDLKSGKLKDGNRLYTKNFDSKKQTKANDPSEEYFVVELSNPNFEYNPVNNQVTIDTSSGDVEQTSEMKIIWKGAPLAGSSEVLSRTITLHWSNDKDASTIMFDSKGGSAVPMIRLLTGASLANRMPEDPVRIGYTFAGWYTDEGLTQPFTATTMPAGNTTLYAKWTPNVVNYTVEHYKQSLNGQYELAETDILSGLTDSETVASARTYEGFTAQKFKQQNIAGDGSTIVSIYYDRNLYELKFDFDNGNEATIKYLYEAEIVINSYPSKEGFIFNGWDGTIPDRMPAMNLSYKALWVENTNGVPYTVKHIRQALDGTYPDSGELVEYESLLGLAGQPTYASVKTYTGFTVQPVEQKTVAANGTTMVEIRYTRNIHSLTWEVNEGNPLTGEYTQGNTKYGAPIILPDEPRRKDYRFIGWYKDEGLTVPLEENATMPDEPLTLYAKWEWYSANYTVEHYIESLDGEFVLQDTDHLSDTIGFETSAAAKDYEGFTVQPFDQQTIADDGSAKVLIYYDRNTYELTFDDAFGNVVTTTVPYEAAIVKPDDPSRENLRFFGWDSEVPETMPAGDLTFRAVWGYPYTVQHARQSLTGGYPPDLVETEIRYGIPGTNAPKEPKEYEGFTATLPGQEFPIAEDGSTTMTILYTRNTYNLSWDLNYPDYNLNPLTGNYTRGATKYGAAIQLPNTPTRSLYTFGGWFKDPELTIPLEENPTMPAHDMTLYAKWNSRLF